MSTDYEIATAGLEAI